jgi:hypothetical protein
MESTVRKIHFTIMAVCAVIMIGFFALPARAATQTAVGAAAESKMMQCTYVGDFGAVAANVRKTSSNYHIYQVKVDSMVQSLRGQYKNAWDMADQTGRYVFLNGHVDPLTAKEVLYDECMHHPERFRVVY